ncbi:hypothetical protein ONS95_012357 [Cadophora gregata]|uniref:uncharacterized protein n=1 Tax=Cadophora gregata TaxID=51156 RepID=UPI0026DC20EB|nr:uncharacterized protein ONS95_012357 [Cadophora gregata]KAK0118047.1 hypothetical protein ONS95_012357 [Cadophora gregata]
MPSLVIPESGLTLHSSQGSPSKAGSSPPDVFGLTLTDSVIEEMIRCVQNGKELQLSFGEQPSLSYGTKVQNLQTSDDPFTYDIFQSANTSDSDSSTADMSSQQRPDMKNGVINVRNKPNLSWIASITGKRYIPAAFAQAKSNAKPTTSTATAKTTKPASDTTSADAALSQLQGALASEKQKKLANTTQIINGNLAAPRRGGPAPKSLTNKSKFLSQKNRSLASDTTRSMPSSPALSGAGSPSLGPTSVPLSQQQAEKAKEARKPVIHLLAVEPLAEKTLQKRLPDVSENDLDNALRKVGDLNETTGKWELRKAFWKELDVWAYKYGSKEDRQRAIDNAVKQYDKMRLGVSEPEWDRLLTKAERGTGKCLSKLQAEIAKGSLAARKSNSQNTEGSGRDTPNGEEDQLEDKTLSKIKGESMARSASQPPATKSKKTSEKEAQAKRLFSKHPPKSANKPAPKSTAPAKKSGPVPKAGTKVLSAEYVEDSEDDSEAPVPSKESPTKEKTTKEKIVKEKPKAKPTKPAVMKRAREEDHDTSDSSIPLSKKVKKDVPVTAATHRVSDASQTSRTTNSSYSSFNYKNKSNSPQKSSPLASSPPTNASDIENSSNDRTSSSASPAPRFSTKNTRSPIHKRHQKSSSVTSSSSNGSRLKPKAIELAAKYRLYYPRYVELFEEVVAEGDKRTKSKERDLLDMHSRLEKMRKDIAIYMADE